VQPAAIGVLGLGRMGRHHVHCAGEAQGVRLAGVCDADPAKERDLPSGVPFTTDVDELLDRCEAVVLAVPTDRHEELACRILAAGRHLLVEKPFAATVAACRRIEAVAQATGRVVGVGHVERLNGAYASVAGRIREPRFVEGHRLAAFDPRGTEVDVVLDLMIHDLDLVLDVFAADAVRVEAVGVPVLTDRVDIANARLEFPGGALVNLTASRASREPVRKLRFFQHETYLSLDLGKQVAEIFTRDARSPLGVSRTTAREPEGHNPLVRELEAFADAIRGEPSRLVGPGEATRAVALAERVRQSIDERLRSWPEAATPGEPPWAGAPSSS
jgi:predicted dehydrogenase